MALDDTERRHAKLRAFCQFMLLYGAVRSWLWVKLIPFEAPLLPLLDVPLFTVVNL